MKISSQFKTIFLCFFFIVFYYGIQKTGAQNVAITDDDSYIADPSAMLDVKSTTKGILIPRVTSSQRIAISLPQIGLLVFDTDSKAFFFWDGVSWINLSKGQIWSVNSDYVFLTDVNDKVGIGTSTPNSKLEVKADASFTDTDTLFVVKDKNGYPVFAVFPDGAKVYVNANSKGSVGGFAVSGRTPTKFGEQSYLHVTPDSTRIYVNDSATVKGTVGGFAISGRTPTKGTTYNYFMVNGDSTRVYINDSVGTKGKIGGFAISGRTPTKGFSNNYMEVTADSTRIYVPDSTLSKGSVGGFAISGRTPTKGVLTDYFNITASKDAEKINNESRIMWYPTKAALLAGEVHVGSADSVGKNSVALGYRTISKGEYSQAMGFKAQALGKNSTAIGNYAFARSDNSFAIGDSAVAEGIGSYAIGSVGRDASGNSTGEPVYARGNYSVAFGLGTKADAINAFAWGNSTLASGISSTAFGINSIASGSYSIAGGRGCGAIGFTSIAIGDDSYAGEYSVALGQQNVATAQNAVAIGRQNWAEYNGAIALGYGNEAQGLDVVAIGIGNYCSSYAANSFGGGNKSNGVKSMTLGYYNTASNEGDIAIGNFATASGQYSIALGIQNKASGLFSMSFGRYIEAAGDYSVAFALNDQNGTIVTQNNTMAIMGGNVGIGTISPSGKLEVMGKTKSITTTGTAAGMGQFQSWAAGTAQGQIAAYSLYPTFQGTSDNTPRRAADITSGFNGGAWGNEYLAFHVGNSGTSNDGQNITSEKMRINGSGDIGIGTTSPSAKLDVSASGAKTGNYNGVSFINTATSSTASIVKTGLSISSTGTWNGTSAVNRGLYVNVSGGATNYAAVFTGGYVGIGTASPYTDFHVSGNSYFGGNIGIGTLQYGNGTQVIAIESATAPTINGVNSVLLYSQGTNPAELKVRDEAGNITTLSPHNFDFIPKSEPMAWSFHSENADLGQRIVVDMLKTIRLVENLSGEQLVYISEIEGNKPAKVNAKDESLVEMVKKQQETIDKLVIKDKENADHIETLITEIELLKAEFRSKK